MSQSSRNESFFALLHLLSDSNFPRANSRARCAAAGIVDAEIVPVLRAAFANRPQLDTEEIFKLIRPALINVIIQIVKR